MNHLAHPQALALLALIPIVAVLLRRRTRPISFSYAGRIASMAPTWRIRLRGVPAILRLAAFAAIIVAISRPQKTSGETKTSTEGIAIQIVLDRSGSMNEPIDAGGRAVRKIDVVKNVIAGFVQGDGSRLKGRDGDMIGMIAFARYADTISPLARVHGPLLDAAKQLQVARTREEDGTAIGDGLALAAARLKRAEEEVARLSADAAGKPEFTIKSKIVILLTDGMNNAGEKSPYEAAALAKQWGIRVYAIGVGATQDIDFFGGRMPGIGGIDERMLTEIAEETGGKYWSAEDAESLQRAYVEIDSLEKSKIETTEHTNVTERFAPFAAAALCLIFMEILFASTFLRRTSTTLS